METGWDSARLGAQQTQYRGNGGLGQANAAGDIDESASRIRDTIGMTEELIGRLHSTIDRVEKRLDTILTPVPQQPAAGIEKNPTPMHVASHLLGRLGNQNESIQHAIERLNRLAQRVEI